MSAETLRKAASLMRERATDATEGPWLVTFIPETAVPSQHLVDRWYVMGCFDQDPRRQTGPAAMCEYEPDVRHIASWHPAVALAVADWLDCQADTTCDCGVDESALAVARAYLGEQP